MAAIQEESKRPIIIKRIKKGGGGHHGGAWKIAYADFVTAMMAFFLLMWLLGSTAKGDLQGISEYFKTPLKVAMQGGSGSGDSSSVLKGGGTDLTRSTGQVKKGDTEPEKKLINLQAAKAELEKIESRRLQDLKSKLDIAIDASAKLRPYKSQIRVDLIPDGLRIQVVDEQNRPMFDTGSAVLKTYTRDILREIGTLLNDVPNRLSLSGHTDSTPYAQGERGYSNWELSADRASASRRELVGGGIEEKKIIRVVGLGTAVMLDKENSLSPTNRRISITILNQKAEQRILEDGVAVPSDGIKSAIESILPAAPAPASAARAPVAAVATPVVAVAAAAPATPAK